MRPTWFDPLLALAHAGGLTDAAAGRRAYLKYLSWLQEDEPARKEQRFEAMSQGWIIGTQKFAQEFVKE